MHGCGLMNQTEAAIQQDIRLIASRLGANLWRNNSGAVTTNDGRHIRFGLGNDSKNINDEFKSPDLIGITPVMITPQHVGRIVGIYTEIEAKHGGWVYNVRDLPKSELNERERHELAQWKHLNLVQSKGGFATFATSIEDYLKCLNITG